ncbi:hypothetical protein EDD21DRAFT_426112 [Dissophora ornata]|nr:hypothetical protein EDD21DRAFT_426112 [Dissophora ornata]
MSGTEESKFLESGSFLLDNFALDTTSRFRFGAIDASTQSKSVSTGSGLQQYLSSKTRTGSNGMGVISRSESKGASKVTFSAQANVPHGSAASTAASDSVTDVVVSGPRMDEAAVAEALAQRIASHKAKEQHKNGDAGGTDIKATPTLTRPTSVSVSISTQDFPEIVLSKPVSRKKVRHVQIQTQHCVMRPMHTQTEPFDSMVHDLEVKHWPSHPATTSSSCSVSSGNSTTEVRTPTACDAITTHPLSSLSETEAPISPTSGGGLESEVVGLVASVGQPATASSDKDDDELVQLRQQNVLLQAQVAYLERDLAAETRARTRTAVAMQDTRDKFEMLSAIAYKKLKEMIFQRHVLEMEVRELRGQVDLQSEENVVQRGEMLFRQEQIQMQIQQQ